MADPVNNQDAATKAWVLSQVSSGVVSSQTSRAATTANITLSGTQTVDSVALSANDVCLVKNQTLSQNNGLYVVQAAGWTRHAAMATWAQVPGMIVSVQQGATLGDTIWLSTADSGGTLNTTPISFAQIPGPSDVQAGAGLTRTGQSIDVIAADNSLTINPDSMQVKLDTAGAILTTTGGTGGLQVQTNNSIIISSNKLKVDGGVILWKTDLIVRETPTGTINGVNPTFTLASTPVTGSEMIFLNGVLLESGAGNDYTISGGTLTMLTTSIPVTNDRLKATYMRGSTPTLPN